MKRSKAEDVLDYVRSALALKIPHERIEHKLMSQYGVEPMVTCDGEAHQNPYIDHCHHCAPRWGVKGTKVKIT